MKQNEIPKKLIGKTVKAFDEIFKIRDWNNQEIIRRFRNMATSEPQKLQELLQKEMPNLSKHQLEQLSHQLREFYNSKYKSSNIPKYGRLNKYLQGFQKFSLMRIC